MDIKRFFSIKTGNPNTITVNRNKWASIAKVLIMICAVACFTHYNIARTAVYITAGLFCILPGTRDKIFVHQGNIILTVFSLTTAVVALVNKNILGFGCAFSFMAMIIVSSVTRSIATKRFYEKLLDFVVMGGVLATAGSIVERIIYREVPGYRCTVFFPNPNFFGAAIMLVILICAYKAVTKAKNVYIYYIAAVFNAVGMYLCGSMSLWIVAAIGIIMLLIISHKYKLLAIFLGIGVVVLTVCLLVPEFLPRINEMGDTTSNRITIWNFAIKHIKDAPVFGRGFFSYKHLYNLLSPTDPTIYKASLSHNILIDSLLCHGIVGTCLIGLYLIKYVRDIFTCQSGLKKYGYNYNISKFIVAVAAAVACYGMIDTTVIWIQTGMVLLFIASGIGVEERTLRHIKNKKELGD